MAGFHAIKITLFLLVAVGEKDIYHPVPQREHFYTPDSMHPRGHKSSQLGCFILKVFKWRQVGRTGHRTLGAEEETIH